MWIYVHREFFFTIFGQFINVLNYKRDCMSALAAGTTRGVGVQMFQSSSSNVPEYAVQFSAWP